MTSSDRSAYFVDNCPRQYRITAGDTRLSHPRAYANWSALLLLAVLPPVIQAQTPDPASSGSIPDTLLDAHQRSITLEHRIDELTNSARSHSEKADVRFDALRYATDRSFQVFFVLGAVGSFLGALFLILTALRDRRHHKDYENERKFYEERAHKVEQRQQSFHDTTIQISKERATNESAFADQRLQLGEKSLSQSGDIFLQQIESISKLSSVIDLVERTFQKQLSREEELGELFEQLEPLQKQIAALTEHHEKNFKSACEGILFFERYSRMAWTQLTPEEQTSASRARAQLDMVPDSIVNAAMKKDRARLAHVHQLMGVSAYYSNDINAAASLLEKAHDIFKECNEPKDRHPKAFCAHFLGLIEKNWPHCDVAYEASVDKAIHYLTEANELLVDKKGEFLTPLTLAEVLSYSPSRRDDAGEQLDKLIEALLKQRESRDGLNANQRKLIGRAYLIRGNVAFMNGESNVSLEWFSKASAENDKDPYARLSMAQAMKKGKPHEDPTILFEEGLNLLRASGNLDKAEQWSRVLAFSWAVLAAHRAGDEGKLTSYREELQALTSNVRAVGTREPLFFSPVTKVLVNSAELWKNIEAEADGG